MVVMIHWLQLEKILSGSYLADDPALSRRQAPGSMRLSMNHIPSTSYLADPPISYCILRYAVVNPSRLPFITSSMLPVS